MNAPTRLHEVSLDDKYTLDHGRAFMTGTQALVRLPMLQRSRDLAAGLNTGGFISGYRGSPLGGLDQSLWKAKQHLAEHHVTFQPGVNEDLAATSIWGTQQVGLFPGAKYDGVFAMWYGKGPGVDRCGDVFKHANAAGTAKHGGVLVLAGDDHAAKSSTLAHQSEHILKACLIPVLHPANVQEYLDFGLHGFAMSRFSGCWIGFKCVTDVVESGASVEIHPERVQIALPEDFAMPPGGLNIRWPDGILEQEARLLDYKVYAALAYNRANRLDRIVWDSPRARFGIITTGKSYGDTMQALADLGIDENVARDVGIRVYKIAMPWPLEPQGVRRFAQGLEEILVVEEKRQVIEYQLKEELYNWHEGERAPRVVGKFDDNGEWSINEGKPAGNWLLPAQYELSPALVVRALAQRFAKLGLDRAMGDRYRARLAFLEAKEKALAAPKVAAVRQPYFCSGCPHNTSTRVPEGSRALAGIGCHFMALWMDRSTATFTHMGGEGAPWIGQAPFTDEKHVFVNLGDGTYFHSGLMAIRAAVAAKVNATYKILYNDAVAMTGGQRHDGPLDPAQISRQIAAEGVQPVVIVTDEPEKYPTDARWAEGVTIRHRDDLDAVQRELRETPGVSAIIYDQTCASEKRRRRKRNEYPDPAKRAVINEMVCEGCGDCSAKSNCLSVEPLETEFGRKRQINQSSCNKDFSCVKGFCPSFVTVEGGALRKGRGGAKEAADAFPPVPAPIVPALGETFGVLVTGVGGTGVITVGQILAMAAHLEGRGVSVLDMSGLAQKGGPVMSHVKIAANPDDLHSTRLGTGAADLVLGCDLIVTASSDAISRMSAGTTQAVVNDSMTPTAAFVKDPDWRPSQSSFEAQIAEAVGPGGAAFVPAGRLATGLMGDSIATNMFVLGYAFQRGWVPLAEASILRAIELNGVSVEFNRKSFVWGRRAAADLGAVEKLATPAEVVPLSQAFSRNLDEVIERRVALLTAYQDAGYARRYRSLVDRVRKAESEKVSGSTGLAEAVARYFAKLLAYKDEYEVARLYSDPAFLQKIAGMFEGNYRLRFHLAPPILSKPDPATGEARKREFGPWMMKAFGVLAKLRFLRGTPFDVFGHTDERRLERQLIADYEKTVEELAAKLTRENHATAVAIAAIPEEIRGFGHVKARHLAAAKKKEADLLSAFRNPRPAAKAA
ncbi:MAG: indolepyruvate ferredoxin oxidoreductase family protein [Proteobacteria bacterium]|nr:indolepyruvate ferredoxin oxidoreductase family protein [Pseudomonadota bacterium]